MKSSGTAGKSGPPTYPTSNNPSLLMDKFNVRRSTPDSEALASSDDEIDPPRQIPPVVMAKPTRRSSWLNDNTQPLSQPRKSSFASSSMSPTASHPTTPSVDSGPWANHGSPTTTTTIGRGTSSFPWGSGIWNSGETRKEPPARLTEVLPLTSNILSPTSSGGGFHGAGRSDLNQDGTIPFAIPLHPTPKTYRSQSYSVGQLDSEVSTLAANAVVGQTNPPLMPGISGRGRGAPSTAGLQHRPSRPSMLSEVSNDSIGLGKVKEVDDDEDDRPGSRQAPTQMDQSKALEELSRENAILRQQNIINARLRSRSTTQQIGSSMYSMGTSYGDSDYAIDELDEIGDLQGIGSRQLARRLSEYTAAQNANPLFNSSVENRKLENVKKGFWQSSLGFGGLEEIPQSRRHSFADVPTRHGSISSVGDGARDLRHDVRAPQEQQNPYIEYSKFAGQDPGEYTSLELDSNASAQYAEALLASTLSQLPSQAFRSSNLSAASSFFGSSNLQRNMDPYSMSPYPPAVYNSYSGNPQYGGGRASSPHRNMYGLPQPRQNQLLYMVLFKCSRADVFYVQEGTGLAVKPGDLVIVEADRGTDLGTVAQDNVEWAQAKELKEHYAEEHYKWLMMYSQGAAGTADGTGAGLMAASNGLQGSAVGGMGPPNQHGMQEPVSGELKPKIIKRLAQPHEIQALREKEGNEAKAKRVCMQKVKEHGLHMEILDAEFQMDWKKLTFYYFADAYINFNSLVTDLFKVYKTRIWMSAINPASFASPSIGLQAPSGIGPGAVGVSRPGQGDRRLQQDTAQGNGQQASRGYIGGTSNTFGSPGENRMAPTGFQSGNYASYGYSAFASPRASASSMGGGYPTMDQYSTYSPQGEYHNQQQRFGQDAGLAAADYSRQPDNPTPGTDAWMNAMQTLSLNSR